MIGSESTHFYHKDGRPCYTVEAKNGSMRPTTLADARKLDLVPSVSLILKVAAQPGLEQWKLRKLLEASLTLPKRPTETVDEFSKRVIEDSQEEGRKAAERGTGLHKAIEEYIKGQTDFLWKDHLVKLEDTLKQYGIDLRDAEAEHTFASPLGYGGKLDWKSKGGIILDFKTKERIEPKAKLVYETHTMQLGAYGCAAWAGKFRAANVFIGVEDKEIRICEHSWEDIENGWEMFKLLLRFWQLKTKFV